MEQPQQQRISSGRFPSGPDRALAVEIPRLQGVKPRVQESVGGVNAFHLGLGSSASDNSLLRRQVGIPGAPFAGLGFIDPQLNREPSFDGYTPPPEVTADFVRATKLQEFRSCMEGKPSIYFWALQPMYDARDRCVAAEILLRAANGYDGAPFEDVAAIMDPAAPEETRAVYVTWKATELVDWPLKVFKDHTVLQNLSHLSVNMRPLDLCPSAEVFQEIKRRLDLLSEEDRALLLEKTVIEVTEDQAAPDDFEFMLETWTNLGFLLSCDDTIGELACEALGGSDKNFHTTLKMEPVMEYFAIVKVDTYWAGFLLFLSHPSYANNPAAMAEVLRFAREKDSVYIPQGKSMRKIAPTHSALLAEFASWILKMIQSKKKVCIELTIRPDNENNAFALNKLKELDLDIFGDHREFFLFQGGLTGARAFTPTTFASTVEAPVLHQKPDRPRSEERCRTGARSTGRWPQLPCFPCLGREAGHHQPLEKLV